ncbi:MAG: PspC domain-containing protein [Spirochaetales bacterium]|nr:PspC domain-containing protein [Spirochaetales bacterium]
MTKKLYRARNGKFLGVCQGIADWRDVPVAYVRWGLVLAALFLNFPLLITYIITAFILEPAPRETLSEKEFSQGEESYSRFKSRFNTMKEDLNSKERDWENRFRDSP